MLSAQVFLAAMKLLGILASVLPTVLGTVLPRADLAGSSSVLLDLESPHVEFKSKILNDTALRFVRNSGVCETTPGVNQLSGYIDIGTNMSMVSRFRSSLCVLLIESEDSGSGSLKPDTIPRLRRSLSG